MKQVEIKGNSGCNIQLIDNYYILKSTNNPNYVNRLVTQGHKQINEYNRLTNNNLNLMVPKIYNIVADTNYGSILMDYINSDNFIDFFNNSTYNDIDIFVDCILSYIDFEINNSTIQLVNKQIFIDKILGVKNACKNNKLIFDYIIFEKINNYINLLPNDIEIPVGQCHGDLTLSNILFKDDKIYLIDFLDTFIESPIQDIIKLRQDTKYYWSLCFYNKKYNTTNILKYLNYIDNKITNYIFPYNDIIYNTYDLFEFINLFRLLPYSKTDNILQFILSLINKKFNEIKKE